MLGGDEDDDRIFDSQEYWEEDSVAFSHVSGEVLHMIVSIVDERTVQGEPPMLTVLRPSSILNPPPWIVTMVPPAFEPSTGSM